MELAEKIYKKKSSIVGKINWIWRKILQKIKTYKTSQHSIKISYLAYKMTITCMQNEYFDKNLQLHFINLYIFT